METFNPKLVIQIAILVKDIDPVVKNWAEYLGQPVPEVVLNNPYEVTQATYKGQPCKARLKQAFFNFDNVQMEIVSPADDLPSYWRDSLAERGEGVHHISFHVEDGQGFREHMEGLNMPRLQGGEYHHGRYSYYDSYDKLKVVIEALSFDDGFPQYGILNPKREERQS